jgi:hypothetical protein
MTPAEISLVVVDRGGDHNTPPDLVASGVRRRLLPNGCGREPATSGPAIARWSRRLPDYFRHAFAFLFGNPESVPQTSDDQADLAFEVAAHESAHALASRLLGTEVHFVTIIQNEALGYAGRAITGSGGFPDLAMNRSAADNQVRIDKMANIVDRHRPRAGENLDVIAPWIAAVHVAVIKLMAGAAGEVLMIGQANDRRCAGDYLEAKRLALTVTANANSAQAFMEFAGVEALEMLRPYRAVLLALAAELAEKRELDGPAIDQIITTALIHRDRDREASRQADWNGVIQRAEAFEKDRSQ